MATKRRIEWPTAVVLATTIAALAAVYVLVPDHRGEIATGVGAVGALALALMRGLVTPTPAAPPRERTGREGSASLDLLAWLAIAAAALIAWGTTGCGAGALASHARAASIAVLALQGADDLAETAALAAVEACSDEACLRDVERTTEAIDAGIATAGLAVSGYVEAVRLGVLGGESPDLLSALGLAVLRLVREWGRLGALYVPLGVTLPGLPAGVTSAGGGS